MLIQLALTVLAALQTAKDAPTAPAVSVPSYPNVSCPIMGKPISKKLFVDTDMGRIWVCCKACNKDILADTTAAHATAYPAVEKVTNTICPLSGEPIVKDSPRIALQGFEFSLAKKECVEKARVASQVVLAKLRDPKLVDVGNQTCPVTGAPASANSFVVVDGAIVRLSSDKSLDEVQKEPAKVLAKAREIAAKQPKPPEAPAPPKQG